MGCTVAELEVRLSSREFAEWLEFYQLEPWGWEADCFKAGIIAATIANVHRDTRKKAKPFEAVDFVPGYNEKPKKIDPEMVKAQLQLAFAGARKNGIQRQDRGSGGARTSTKRARPRTRPKGRR